MLSTCALPFASICQPVPAVMLFLKPLERITSYNSVSPLVIFTPSFSMPAVLIPFRKVISSNATSCSVLDSLSFIFLSSNDMLLEYATVFDFTDALIISCKLTAVCLSSDSVIVYFGNDSSLNDMVTCVAITDTSPIFRSPTPSIVSPLSKSLNTILHPS